MGVLLHWYVNYEISYILSAMSEKNAEFQSKITIFSDFHFEIGSFIVRVRNLPRGCKYPECVEHFSTGFKRDCYKKYRTKNLF